MVHTLATQLLYRAPDIKIMHAVCRVQPYFRTLQRVIQLTHI